MNEEHKRKKMKKSTPKRIGKCPFCDGNLMQKSIMAHGQKAKLYSCSNMKVEYCDGDERFLETEESTCSFRIFSNSLLRYGKRSISPQEVKRLTTGERTIVVRLYSKKLYNEEKDKYGSEYYRYAIPDQQYGISVLFDLDVEEEDLPEGRG